jgi:regulator of PEP synthase PpsR (kinase-PPPase family)
MGNSSPPGRPRNIFVLSDGTGETAEKVVRASLLQFTQQVDIRVYPRVRKYDEMQAILGRAHEQQALVVFTIVNLEQREDLYRLAFEHQVEAVDLIGALIVKLSAYLDEPPHGTPGLLHTISEEYFQRVDAVEFAVRNDDGQDPRSLARADLVLVGVSRTSKTPLSMFLAQKGLRVANQPLVLGIDPPAELEAIAPERVVGLTIDADALVDIRQSRLRAMGMPPSTNYALHDHVQQELDFAHAMYRRHPEWAVVDVTRKAVEETAADILRLRRSALRRRNA